MAVVLVCGYASVSDRKSPSSRAASAAHFWVAIVKTNAMPASNSLGDEPNVPRETGNESRVKIPHSEE